MFYPYVDVDEFNKKTCEILKQGSIKNREAFYLAVKSGLRVLTAPVTDGNLVPVIFTVSCRTSGRSNLIAQIKENGKDVLFHHTKCFGVEAPIEDYILLSAKSFVNLYFKGIHPSKIPEFISHTAVYPVGAFLEHEGATYSAIHIYNNLVVDEDILNEDYFDMNGNFVPIDPDSVQNDLGKELIQSLALVKGDK